MRKIFTLLMLFATVLLQAQIEYDQLPVNFQVGTYVASQWGDFNNDSLLDLIIIGQDANNDNYTKIYQNLGNDQFNEVSNTGLPGVSIGGIDLADFNNDGFLDIILAGTQGSNNITNIFFNNGDLTFDTLNLKFPQTYMGDISACDFDNDGNIDFAVSGDDPAYNMITEIYQNNGDSTFTRIDSLPGVMYGILKWADYNNDSLPDLLVTGFNSDFYTKIWKNNGDSTFSETSINLQQVWLNDAEWGDFDNDGDMDLFLTGVGGSGSDRYSIQYTNTGNDLVVKDSSFVGVSHSSVELADFDNDGDLDIFYAGLFGDGMGTGDYMAKLLFNDGNGNFNDSLGVDFPGVYWGECSAGDYNNDSLVDIFICGNTFKSSSDVPIAFVYKAQLPVSYNQLVKSSLKIYPNPVMNFVNIRNDKVIKNVKIYDISGKLVFDNNFNSNSVTFGVQQFSAGVYNLVVTTNLSSENRKLIIK